MILLLEPCVHSSRLETFHDHDQVQSQDKDQAMKSIATSSSQSNQEPQQIGQINQKNIQEPQQIGQTTAANKGSIASQPSACQPTLHHHLSLNQTSQDLRNQGNNIYVHGPSHQGPRTMLIVHAAH